MIPIVVYEGVAGTEALGALAALRAAGLEAELTGVDAMVATREGARLVSTRLGYRTLATAEAVVVPGGESAKLLADALLAKELRARRGKWTLFSGEAILLADRVGLTEGRETAAPPTEAGPVDAKRTPGRLVADGRVLTSRAGDALTDLALHYAALQVGDDEARKAAETLGREWRPFVRGAGER